MTPPVGLPIMEDIFSSRPEVSLSLGEVSVGGAVSAPMAKPFSPPTRLTQPTSNVMPCVPKLGDRWDAPVLVPTRRACKAKALSVVMSAASKAEALRALTADVSAASSSTTLDSMLATWTLFHKSWFGSDSDPFPLTCDRIAAVSSMFKAGVYRSFANYMSRAKDRHVELYKSWPDDLARAARRCTRSVLRGIGPAKQAGVLDMQAIKLLQLSDAPLTPSGPVGPGNLMEMGTFWLPREIEVSLALLSSVTHDVSATTYTWNLPASKSDPKGLGKDRTWGCACEGDYDKICGYHAMHRQFGVLSSLFGHLPAFTDGTLPLFPDIRGMVCTKESVVATFEQATLRIGKPIRTEDNVRILGGHSLRVTGAQYLASLGFSVALIQLIARHESDIILRYVQDAPLLTITQEYKSRIPSMCLPTVAAQSIDDPYILAPLGELSNSNCWENLQSQVDILKSRLVAAEQRTQTYVCNNLSEVVHFPVMAHPVFPQDEWKARCGWKFGSSNHSMTHAIPTANFRLICSKCLPLERLAVKAQHEPGAHSDTSSSSSSSSEKDREV